MPTTVTLDTNVLDATNVRELARKLSMHVAAVTVSKREAEGSSFADLLDEVKLVPETAVWDQSRWDEAVFAGPDEPGRLDAILSVVSNGSFQRHGELTPRQRNQLNDAMILTAHSREGRDIFVSNDERAFVRQGRREKLQILLQTKILTSREFIAEFGSPEVSQ